MRRNPGVPQQHVRGGFGMLGWVDSARPRRWAWLSVVLAACSPQQVDVVGCPQRDCDGGPDSIASAPEASASGRGGGDGLRHRYSFDATPDATAVVDSIGGANGTLVGAAFGIEANAGSVLLAGAVTDQYVDLPNHLLEGIEDVTFEAWFTWGGGGAWQRIFDFGEDDTGIDDSRAGEPRSYMFLACNPQPHFAFKQAAAESLEMIMAGAEPLPTNQATHVAVVLDTTARLATLYVAGAPVASLAFPARLSDVSDVNNWLGRSQYRIDPSFQGRFDEFRIYDRALTGLEVEKSYQAGPEAIAK